MFYIIYETTNIINGFIYVGQHSTTNIDDGYLGSGTRFTNALLKYGIHAFSRRILHRYDSFHEMNSKEAEIVNEDFVKRADTYNIIPGGRGWNTKDTVVVRVLEDSTYFRIPKNEIDPSIHAYPTSNSVRVIKISSGEVCRVSVEEYRNNKHLYRTASTGKVSVRFIETGSTGSIPVNLFDPKIHVKVFGGKVIDDAGMRRYATTEDNHELVGIHVGKVTVKDSYTDKICHVTTEEYYSNKDRYSTLSAKTNRKSDHGTTKGMVTVFIKDLNKFGNIKCDEYNPDIHMRASDKKIECYSPSGDLLFTFWGNKSAFLIQHGCTKGVWEVAIKGETYSSYSNKNAGFNGCYFKIINWKGLLK